MRDEKILEAAISTVEARMEDGHPITNAMNQAKRDALLTLTNGDNEPADIERATYEALAVGEELPFEMFLQVQAARNVAAFADGRLDSI